MRFSLRTLILVVVIAGLIGTAFFLQRKNEEVAAENGRLKEELGYLAVGDKSKIYVRELGGPGYYARSWRVYVPETQDGAVYFVQFRNETGPEFDFDWPMEAGKENILYVEVSERTFLDDASFMVKAALNDWTRSRERSTKVLLGLRSSSFGERTASQQKEFAADARINLLRAHDDRKWPDALRVEIALLNAEEAKAAQERDK